MEDQEDSGPSAIVARADALMQRQRSRLPNPEDVPLLTEVVDPNADLPVLTAVEPLAPAVPDDDSVNRLAMEFLAEDLARRVSERLTLDIPALVQRALTATLPDLARELEAELAKSADGAIRDFLTERKKLAKIQQS